MSWRAGAWIAVWGFVLAWAQPSAAQVTVSDLVQSRNSVLVPPKPTPVRPVSIIPPPELLAPGEPIDDAIFEDDLAACDLADGCCMGMADGPCASCSGWFLDGWLAQGFTYNADNPANRMNTPLTFNDRANEYEMNQLYLQFGRAAACDGCCWDVGGQVDLLYGTDYFFVQATGLETTQTGAQHWNSGIGPRAGGAGLYGLAMPQLYAELYAPLGHGLNVKFGHFYSIMGYESAMAPANFFYSHSYARQYAEPFTHTGVLADWQLSCGWSVQGGLTRGWNVWEDPTTDIGFLGGASWNSDDGRTCVSFALHTGDERAGAVAQNRTAYSLVAARQMTDCLTYVIQHDYGTQEDGAQDGDAQWWGIVNYLYYTLSDCAEVGFRFEWFDDRNNARVLAIPLASVEGSNYYAATLGLNWRPHSNVRLRPELRWDWSNVVPPFGGTGMYNDFTDKRMFTAALDLIVTF